jgi:tetratricopeptide (TPR) repeat protein
MAFYDTVDLNTPESFERAARLLERALDDQVRPPLLVAMLGSVHAVMAVYGLVDDAEATFVMADALAREALAEDAHLWLAHMVLATTAVGRHRWDEAVAHADDVVGLAPEHPTAIASAAMICVRANAWARATAWADRALRLNPALPTYVRVLLAVDCLLRDDDAGALAEATLVDVPGMPWGPLYRGLALAGLGRLEDADRELQEAERLHPGLLADPAAYLLGGFQLDDDQREALLRRFTLVADRERIPEQAAAHSVDRRLDHAAD